MAYCSECGNELREQAKFCDVCGTPRVERTTFTQPQKETSVEDNTPVMRATTTSPHKWKAIVSLVAGLVSVLAPCLCCIDSLVMGILGFICGVTALVFAFLSRKDTDGHFCGMSIAGLILSIFGIFISLVVVIFTVVFMIAEPYMPDFDDYWQTYYWIKDTFGDDVASAYERIMSIVKG